MDEDDMQPSKTPLPASATDYGQPWRKHGRKIWKRDGPYCCYCAQKLIYEVETTQYEHLIPRSWGGSDELDNLAIACGNCNKSRGDRALVHFLGKDKNFNLKPSPIVIAALKKEAEYSLNLAKSFERRKSNRADLLRILGLLSIVIFVFLYLS